MRKCFSECWYNEFGVNYNQFPFVRCWTLINSSTDQGAVLSCGLFIAQALLHEKHIVSVGGHWLMLQWRPSDIFHALEGEGCGVRSIISCDGASKFSTSAGVSIGSGQGRQGSEASLKQDLPWPDTSALLPCSPSTLCVMCSIQPAGSWHFGPFFPTTPRGPKITA